MLHQLYLYFNQFAWQVWIFLFLFGGPSAEFTSRMGSHVPFVHDGCLGMGLALKNGENGKTCLQEDFLYELLDFPLLTLRAGLYGIDVVFTVYSFTYYPALSPLTKFHPFHFLPAVFTSKLAPTKLMVMFIFILDVYSSNQWHWIEWWTKNSVPNSGYLVRRTHDNQVQPVSSDWFLCNDFHSAMEKNVNIREHVNFIMSHSISELVRE